MPDIVLGAQKISKSKEKTLASELLYSNAVNVMARSSKVLWVHIRENDYVLRTGRVLEPSFEEILLLDGKVRVKQVDGTKCAKPWNRARQSMFGER